MNIRQKLAQFAQYRQTVRELRALDPRQLRDIGLTADDVRDVARRSAL